MMVILDPGKNEDAQKIVSYIEETLDREGIQHVRTVEEGKTASVEERCKEANRWKRSESILISVDINTGKKKENGWTAAVYHYSCGKSRKLASCLKTRALINKIPGTTPLPGSMYWETNHTILRGTSMPSVLIGNPENCNLSLGELGDIIVEGIKDYYDL